MALMLIAPMIGWSWPSLVPITIAVASGLGYKKLSDPGKQGWLRGRLTAKMENLRRVSVPVDEVVSDLVGEEIGRDDRLVFERENIRLVFRRDPRGKFFVDVLGHTNTPALVLRREGRQFARELVREFAYNRVMQEMQARGLNVVAERVEEETGERVINVQRWS